jgi:hypothetical protein
MNCTEIIVDVGNTMLNSHPSQLSKSYSQTSGSVVCPLCEGFFSAYFTAIVVSPVHSHTDQMCTVTHLCRSCSSQPVRAYTSAMLAHHDCMCCLKCICIGVCMCICGCGMWKCMFISARVCVCVCVCARQVWRGGGREL